MTEAELVDEHELDMWQHDDGSSLLERFNEFERKGFVTTVSVEVRLVGFQGFGNERIILPAHSVLKHLDAFTELGPERLHVGHTEHTTSNPRNLSGHDLNVFQQLLYTASDYGLENVDKNGNTLLKNINKVVDDSVVKAQRSYLPISSIDRLVADDYETNLRIIICHLYLESKAPRANNRSYRWPFDYSHPCVLVRGR